MVETGKRSKEATAGTITEGGKIGGDFKVAKNPEFLAERLAMFQRIYEKQQEELKNFQKREIDITLKDGKVIKGVLFETTPLAIATKISKKLAASVYGAKIVYSKKEAFPLAKGAGVVDADDDGEAKGEEKGEIYDLTRPLEGDCTLELLNFDDPHAKNIFWHSSAHILGCALEQEFGAHLCIGPALEKGFYYDAYMGEHKISPNEFPNIEKAISTIIAADHPFKKIYLTKAEALELFKHNPFKVQLISKKIPEDAVTTAYCSGSLVDLCTGPHLPSTGIAKAFKCTKASAAYWLAKSENDDLQRVYGISFPQQKLLDEYIKVQEALIQGDHRTVGRHQNLFTLIDMSPGSAFFLPHGARIYNKLTTLMRREYALRGYTEVITPNMYNKHLWEVSGHWYKYKDNIFQLKVEDQEFGMKPMNCPGHCLMFGSTLRSYKELPIRYAEFGVLHRNEISGALSGLTRVRRFVQDDAHIFCTLEQIQSEIEGVLDLLKYVYKIFGFSYKLFLSTRPEGALGEKEIWDNAEEQLKEALNKFGHEWKLNPGDGAFYGPKIDIALCDIYGREHQCGTIQLDFNLPFRFNLQYRAGDDEKEGDGEEEAKETEKKPEGEKKGKGKKGGDKAGEEGEKKPEGEKKGKGKKGGEDKKGAAEEGEKKPEGEKKVEVEKKPEAEKKVETEKKLEEPQSAISQKSNVSFDPSHNVLKPGFQRPVMIHRAIYGSFERFIAVVTEMTGGKWPFWLSPRQIIILPISTEKQLDYAEAIYHRLKFEGFDVEVDRTNSGLNRKVRNAQMQQYNFIAVIGDEEMAQGCVDLRERDKKDRLGKFTIAKLVEFLKSLEVPDSDCKEKLWAKAYFGPDENREAYRPHTQCDHVHAKPEESKKAE